MNNAESFSRFRPGLIYRPSPRLRIGAAPATYERTPQRIGDNIFKLLPTSDQGQTQHCVAYAVAGLIEGINWRDKDVYEQVNPEPIYAKAKTLDGMADQEGTTTEAGFQAAVQLGLIDNVVEGSIRVLQNLQEVKRAIHQHDFVLCAFQITQDWANPDDSGLIPYNQNSPILGAHEVLGCAYSDIDSPNWFGFQNSWGPAIGYKGFYRMQYGQFEEQFLEGLTCELKRR